MSSDNDRYVVQHAGGGWDVKKVGLECPVSHHETRSQAQAAARAMVSHLGGGEVRIEASARHAAPGRAAHRPAAGPGASRNAAD
ncbi:MAG TPA: DUF2188 domain-containing protein [Planctomycetota bacterium]|nr:DUF2188 domain-containing protein [Planctomycetota bacterium]